MAAVWAARKTADNKKAARFRRAAFLFSIECFFEIR